MCGLQLFRQRLSHKSVKAYSTMPIGIMGRKRLALIELGFPVYTNKKRESINTLFMLFPSMSLKHPKL